MLFSNLTIVSHIFCSIPTTGSIPSEMNNFVLCTRCLQSDSLPDNIVVDRRIVSFPHLPGELSTGEVLMLYLQVGVGIHKTVGTELDSIQLSIFSHRFMSTAEQMGRLVNTSHLNELCHNEHTVKPGLGD